MAGDDMTTERSGERPGVARLPVLGALTGAICRTARAVLHAALLPAVTTRPPETRGSGRRDEVKAQITFYGGRSGKVHVTRKGKP